MAAVSEGVRAKITWTRTPPTQEVYFAPVHFEGDPTWPNEAWSLVVKQLTGDDADTYPIRFLVPEAPHYLLKRGARFTLYEGRKAVATGVIV